MKRFAVAIDSLFDRHMPPSGHPERPERIASLLQAVDSWPRASELIRIAPSKADRKWLEAVHSAQHIDLVESTAGETFRQLDPDTWTSPDSHRTALMAAGACVDLTRRMFNGEIDAGFAMVRPPGHHAESRRAMGFCLFNNVAVAAAFALQQPQADRVAVVDFDVHHGNGTQEIFYRRSDVLYISAHQSPLYPGTGDWSERGEGAGRGHTLNFPIAAGMDNAFYLNLFRDFVAPALREQQPDLLLVSAGFDAHRDDPLASMALDERGFADLAALLNGVAAEVCEGRMLYVLEGGYNLRALSDSALAVLEACLSEAAPREPGEASPRYRQYRDLARSRLPSL